MSEPFLAEVRIVGFNFAPRNWAFCDGQILPINQNQSLYSLLGTTYGGDGRTSFALPEMRGRTPIHVGQANSGSTDFRQGQKGGEDTVTLSEAEMPQHTHVASGSSTLGTTDEPNGQILARAADNVYGVVANTAAMGSGTIANVGGGQGHENMQPWLALNYIIALQGLFPSRN